MLVRIPGSSANLGPGFDSFGIAWQLYNEIEFNLSNRLIISGCPEKYQNRDNLCYRAYCAALSFCGVSEQPVSIHFQKNDIPISRGLGSSAALIAGAVTAANVLNNLRLNKNQLLSIATAVEGHPDNIAPALFGGFTVSAMEGNRVVSASFPLSDRLHFTAIVPDTELSTELSRSVLPDSYCKSDAIFNISRAALLIKALGSGDGELINFSLQDKIHQPYRFRLLLGFEKVQMAAESCGACGICISGAGSTMLCVSEKADFTEKIKDALSVSFPGWKFITVKPDYEGAAVI